MSHSNFRRNALATSLGLVLLSAAALVQLPGQADTQAFIVQGTDLAAVRTAVRAVGGEITHEFRVIDAVGTKLTSAQRAALVETEGVLRFYADRKVAVGTAGPTTETVRDDFKPRYWDGNDGTVDWNGNWLEIGANGAPQMTPVTVTIGNYAQFKNAAKGLRRGVSLPAGAVSTLRFDYRQIGFATPDRYVKLKISSDGGANWTELHHFDTLADEEWHNLEFDITPYASADTLIRFRSGFSNTQADKFAFDNIEIEYHSDVVSTDVAETMLDEFWDKVFSNNDGSVPFASDCIEGGEADGPTSGGIKVNERQLVIKKENRSVQRTADLSQAATAQLNFLYRRYNFDPDDSVLMEISNDGGATWVELERFEGQGGDGNLLPISYDISAYASEQTVIRFTTSSNFKNLDMLRVDNFEISYTTAPDTYYPSLVGADQLHDEGIDGAGVTVAVIDTGYFAHEALDEDPLGDARVLAQYDAIADQNEPVDGDTDGNGHGVHVTSLIASSNVASSGKLNGIAPGASLVSVKAFDDNGQGTYMDVIRAIDWVVNNKDIHDIRVLNLSFGAGPRSHYWDDPLNQAVMAAWEAGILVVASAGNTGPDPMTVGVPGNVSVDA